MNFRKTSRGGRGGAGSFPIQKIMLQIFAIIFREMPMGWVISDPKNFVADFSIINEHFLVILRGKNNKFSEKGGGVTPIRKISLRILAPPEKSAT